MDARDVLEKLEMAASDDETIGSSRPDLGHPPRHRVLTDIEAYVLAQALAPKPMRLVVPLIDVGTTQWDHDEVPGHPGSSVEHDSQALSTEVDSDPVEARLRDLRSLMEGIPRLEAAAVREARAAGWTWARIAAELGRSRQGLWQRHANSL